VEFLQLYAIAIRVTGGDGHVMANGYEGRASPMALGVTHGIHLILERSL
jgi:hypothetical protein